MLDLARMPEYAADPLAFFADLEIPSAHGQRRFGDLMADFQRERFASIVPALLAVARGQKPPIGRHWWEATKGASKDSDLACAVLWLLAFTGRPLLCQVGAADADQADELRKAAKDVLYLNPLLSARIEIQTWRLVCKATDSVCEIVAADVGGSHGARPDVLIINELSHITKQEFAENLRDNAAKVPNGLAIIATNAGMLDTWQWKWRELARELSSGDAPRWSFHAYSRPSPWLDPAEIDEARRRNSTSRYNRLWWGIWSTGGDALDGDDIQAAIRTDLQPMAGHQHGYGFVGALDLSVKQDHSAFVVIASHPATQRLRLALCQNWKPEADGRVDLIAVEAAVLAAHRRFQLHAVAYDPYQAELMAQRLTRQNVPMRECPFTPKNLDRMATVLLDVFRSRRIDLYPDAQLVTDLGRLSVADRAYGQRLVAPRDEHGHADRAVALSIGLPFALDVPAHVGQSWGGVIDNADIPERRWQLHDYSDFHPGYLPNNGMPSRGPIVYESN